MRAPFFAVDNLTTLNTNDPILLAAYPWNNSDVDKDTLLYFHFSGKGDIGQCRIWVDGVLIYEYGVGFSAGWTGSDTTITPVGAGSPKGLVVMADRTASFPSQSRVEVSYRYDDAAGRFVEGAFFFITEDVEPASLVRAMINSGNREIMLEFDDTISAAEVVLTSLDGYVPTITETTTEGAFVRIALEEELSFGATYSVAYDVMDDGGNSTASSIDVETDDYVLDCRNRMPQYWLDHLDDNEYLGKLCDLFSEVLSISHQDVDYWRRLWDCDECYDAHVDMHLASLGGTGLITEFITHRKLLDALFDIYRHKGEAAYIGGIIYMLIGIEPSIRQWYEGRFRIGYSKIGGTDSLIGGRDIDPFKIRLTFSRALTTAERRTVVRIMTRILPANITYTIIEPVTTPTYFRIGYSKIGGTDRIAG